MRMRVNDLKNVIREALEDEMSTIEVRDVVDVELDEVGTLNGRVHSYRPCN